jgi:hypothetical protein
MAQTKKRGARSANNVRRSGRKKADMTVDDGATRRETRPHAAMDPTGEVNTDTEGMEEDVHTAQDVSELEDIRGESTTTPPKDNRTQIRV